MYITDYDLIQAISGEGEFGESKCVVALRQMRSNCEGKLHDVDDEFITEKPIVSIFKQPGGFVCVDFFFKSVEDRDLKIMFSYLQRFFQAANSVSDDGVEFPLLTFTFMPREFDGQYWAIGLNPLHYALTPEDSTGEPRVIRVLFGQQEDGEQVPNFLFVKSPDGVLDAMDVHDDEDF